MWAWRYFFRLFLKPYAQITKAATIKMPAPIKKRKRYCGMKPMVNKSIQMANKKKQALANNRLFFVNDATSLGNQHNSYKQSKSAVIAAMKRLAVGKA